jgi:DNA-binding CsgD family transcriptional regulator
MRFGSGLTEVELAIVKALAQGLQSKEIAAALDRSRPTIEFHIRMLFAKMQAKSRAQIVARGYELGVLEYPSASQTYLGAHYSVMGLDEELVPLR